MPDATRGPGRPPGTTKDKSATKEIKNAIADNMKMLKDLKSVIDIQIEILKQTSNECKLEQRLEIVKVMVDCYKSVSETTKRLVDNLRDIDLDDPNDGYGLTVDDALKRLEDKFS